MAIQSHDPESSPASFGDYIVYVDESGDHALDKMDPQYPVFVLMFCLFKKQEYAKVICPAVQELKFKYFGHDATILHEREIRKAQPPFSGLLVPETRAAFMDDVTELIAQAPMTLVAVVIRKDRLTERYRSPDNPYFLALEFGLERVCAELEKLGQKGRRIHVVFECRGQKEDHDLELAFRRTMDTFRMCRGHDLEIVMCDKRGNAAGLQLADLMARPIGRKVMNPSQTNRAYEVIHPKLRRFSPDASPNGYGLKVFP